MVRRGLVLGCGGTVGGAWEVGALAAVQEILDWDPRTAQIIVGTSSGSTLATMLGAGVGVDEMIAAQRGDLTARESVRTFFTKPPKMVPRVPFGLPSSARLALDGIRHRQPLVAGAGLLPAGRTSTDFLDALVDDLVPDGGWVDHPATWVVAAHADWAKRVPFGRPSAPKSSMRDAVRASWAVPGWYPPVSINGVNYLDGGVVSPASADLLKSERVDEVIVIAPMASLGGAVAQGIAGRVEGALRVPMSRTVDNEVAILEATGKRVLRIHPDVPELNAMGANYMNPRRRIAALEVALTYVPARVVKLRDQSRNASSARTR